MGCGCVLDNEKDFVSAGDEALEELMGADGSATIEWPGQLWHGVETFHRFEAIQRGASWRLG